MSFRIVFHNPHTNIWFRKPIYFYITRRKCGIKYPYLLDYCLQNNIPFAFFCDGTDFSFGRSLFRGRVIAKMELMLWCLFNKIPLAKVKIISRFKGIKEDDILFSFLMGNYINVFHDSDRRNNSVRKKLASELANCKALKVAHLTHYMFDVINGASNTFTAKVDLFVAENNLAKNSEFFKHYYNWYKKDVYAMPFVPQYRFKNKNNFANRKNKAVATGTLLYKMVDKAFLNFFPDGELHPMRREIYAKRNDVSNLIDCYIHETEEANQLKKLNSIYQKLYNIFYRPFFVKQKQYFSFNIVDLYNSYKMFVVPEEVIGLPSVGFIEGMACGCVYIGSKNPMYSDMGLVDKVHYIAYDGTFEDLKAKIEFYQNNETLLETIAINSFEYVKKKINGDVISKSFFDYLISKSKIH